MLATTARVLSLHDPQVLERQLSLLGLAQAASLDLMRRWPALPVLAENVADGAATLLQPAAAEQAASLVDFPQAAAALYLGTTGQLEALASRAADGPGSELARALRSAVHCYFAPRGNAEIGGKTFGWGSRTYLMAVLNVTPDSFSGDGTGNDIGFAVEQAERFVMAGADIVDVGGESTRPGSKRIDAAEELRRVLPVVERLARDLPMPVSVDTYKAVVAERCLDAGATLINDIWGLRADPAMAAVIAKHRVSAVLMHNQQGIAYRDLLGDVIGVLRQSLSLAADAGIPESDLIFDPGIGFGKSKEQNLELLHRLDELKVLGRPILLGTSRKSTIGYVLDLPPEERVEGTAATVALGIACGADIVRVHDVREMVRVARMADAVVRWRPTEERHWPGQTG